MERTLQREVLYPQRQNTGVGVMLVASAAMFFAVASSAFILRAKMPMPEHCPHSNASMSEPGMNGVTIHRVETLDVELIDLDEVEATHTHATQCGEPIFHENANGPSSVVFELCAGDPVAP